MEQRLDRIEEKLDRIMTMLTEDVKDNCDKMGEHINFVETIYEDLKNPLGFICNQLNYLASASDHMELVDLASLDV